MDRVEILLAPDVKRRGRAMLKAMIAAAESAGVEAVVTEQWERRAPWLMSYGLGHPERRHWTRQHLADGGRLIGWDLGYWDRNGVDFKMRLTVDHDHPHRLIRPMPMERFKAAGIRLRNDFDPAGHIVLVGLGRKQRIYLDLDGQTWESAKLTALQNRFPGRRILYRPKVETEGLRGCQTARGPIERVLQGASLVVCAHSNVAVDACIAGIPVECEDGAAFALYRQNTNPTHEQRLEFLRSVAWWQWSPREALQAWQFIKGLA